MKELLIEQKAKAYDEALDKVAHFIKKHVGLGCMIHPNSSEAKELFNIFPELKESEDEKIRNFLIDFIKVCGWSEKQFPPREDCIAWLGRQGQTFTKKDVDDEQRDQLKKAIADAGYTFDFEKKELKEIEQKPAWSEEDEIIALSIEQVMNCASLLNIVPEKINKIRTWLKSIKDRVRPKQEWSEEDESYLNTTIAYLKDTKEFKKTAENCIIWLKSLRPQSQWKPSDEQIEILDMVLTNESMDDNIARILRELREQLKKLKGE